MAKVRLQQWGCTFENLDRIAYVPKINQYGETVSESARRTKWNGRAPSCICNAELFDMREYAPASGCPDYITNTLGIAFKDNKTPILSYANNVKAKDWIGAYPILVRDGKNVVTTIPMGLGGRVARTALAFNDHKVAILYVKKSDGMDLKEFANEIIKAGFHTAINLDGGGSTACISPFVKYDQGRRVRGKIAIWAKDGSVNKLAK